jgi:hypothetical protein
MVERLVDHPTDAGADALIEVEVLALDLQDGVVVLVGQEIAVDRAVLELGVVVLWHPAEEPADRGLGVEPGAGPVTIGTVQGVDVGPAHVTHRRSCSRRDLGSKLPELGHDPLGPRGGLDGVEARGDVGRATEVVEGCPHEAQLVGGG